MKLPQCSIEKLGRGLPGPLAASHLKNHSSMAREDCEIEKMLSITEEGQAVTPGAQGHTLLFHFMNRHITEKNRSPYLSYSAHQSTK